MKYDLPKKAEVGIFRLAKKCGIKKIVLFGSRARGTNNERSDIDIAVSGGDFSTFYVDVDEEVETLLMFDVVNLESKISDELGEDIKRDGVVIYEEV
jgi:predicted nucleotidyltransferase